MSIQEKPSTRDLSLDNKARVLGPQDLSLSPDREKKESGRALGICVRALLQNWRQGTVGCKSRGEVAFSNKKPWKQKGTGKARAGSRRSPLWRKGGVTFGPQPRVRTIKINRKQKQQVFASLFNQNLDQGKIIALDWMILDDRPRTNLAFNALKSAGLETKKVILFVSVDDYNTQASFRNIPYVQMLFFDQPNAYALAQGDCWMFLTKDTEAFKQMVGSWI